MKRKILYLRWLDSALTPEWSQAPNEDTGLSEIETVGYIILEDDQHIQVAQSSYEDYKYSAIQSIPKSVILERRILQMPKQKKANQRTSPADVYGQIEFISTDRLSEFKK